MWFLYSVLIYLFKTSGQPVLRTECLEGGNSPPPGSTDELIASTAIAVEMIAVEAIAVETIAVEAIVSCVDPGGGGVD